MVMVYLHIIIITQFLFFGKLTEICMEERIIIGDQVKKVIVKILDEEERVTVIFSPNLSPIIFLFCLWFFHLDGKKRPQNRKKGRDHKKQNAVPLGPSDFPALPSVGNTKNIGYSKSLFYNCNFSII